MFQGSINGIVNFAGGVIVVLNGQLWRERAKGFLQIPRTSLERSDTHNWIALVVNLDAVVVIEMVHGCTYARISRIMGFYEGFGSRFFCFHFF
jgi:hypothetical protein